MITVHLRYEIDADKQAEFAEYGRRWIHLVNRLGGTHHGYFLPERGRQRRGVRAVHLPVARGVRAVPDGRDGGPRVPRGLSVRDRDAVHPEVRATFPLTTVRVSEPLFE